MTQPSPAAALRPQLLERLAAPWPRQPELVLVTDLDGTLLAGPEPWRLRLYGWLGRQRQRVVQVFSTGRALDSVGRLLQRETALGLPRPHLVISDVGCTVACGHSLRPLPELVAPIEARWRGLPERLLPLLQRIPGLETQPVNSDRRLAYLIDPAAIDRRHLQALERHGVDCLISGDRYLDVLPAGINKGSTLLVLLQALGLDHRLVVTAGDSLNDLAMFETGLAGVMVANAEADLRQRLPALTRTFAARGEGCAGIVEGLRHFGYGPLLDARFLSDPWPAALNPGGPAEPW
ncbi:MAG: HAD family hydrolase [Synechococcaceae cyanobacterium]|nr:HAD family hydrolase [Synechococcaceae cyanobacterium]